MFIFHHNNHHTPSNSSFQRRTLIILMRWPSLPTCLRAFYTFSNATFSRTAPAPFTLAAGRPTTNALKSSMPIPFLGALFSTAESRNMSFPVQKSDSEWQAQLSPGELERAVMAVQSVDVC